MSRSQRSLSLAPAVLAALLLLVGTVAAGPLEKGQAALEAGKHAEAAEHFQKALEKSGDKREAAYGLASAVVAGQLIDFADASRDALFDVLDAHDQDLEALIHLGEVSLMLGTNAAAARNIQAELQDAQGYFEEAAAVAPKDPRAGVGVGKALYQQARFEEATAALQAFITKHPQAAGEAHYWMGQIHYLQARDLHASEGGGYPLSEEAASLFRKAQGAYRAGSIGNPDHFETWMQLAYSSQYVGDVDEAVEAYKKAVSLDPSSELPLKGLSAQLQHQPERYAKILGELGKAHPESGPVSLFHGFQLMQQKKYAEAAEVLERGARNTAKPTMHWYYVGEIARAQNDKEAAVKAYRKSLEADPNNALAPAGWEAVILDGRGPAQLARSLTPTNYMDFVAQYDEIFKVHPNNVNQRNNLGLILRDCYVGHGMSSSYDPILHRGTEAYVKASEAIGEIDEALMSRPYAERYGLAQVISDTGLMFQFHPPNKDWRKAEMYYLRALELSDHGYYDAWRNLSTIYTEEEKWDDLYAICEGAAEGLMRDANGNPHQQGRAAARGTMKRLLDEGKVE